MKATIQDLENLVSKINTVLKCDGTWTMQTALTAFIEQSEKFDNVFMQFEDETFCTGTNYTFTVEGLEDFDLDFTIFQMYEDIKKLSFEY